MEQKVVLSMNYRRFEYANVYKVLDRNLFSQCQNRVVIISGNKNSFFGAKINTLSKIIFVMRVIKLTVKIFSKILIDRDH